jgi:hypothetical protein
VSLKQDRQGVRKATDLEQKYNFGKSFAEVMGLAKGARQTADDAKETVAKLDEKLTSEEIFNRLTENGTLQGLYRGDDGEIYINASYIMTGEFLADLIKAGVIKSKDDTGLTLDVDNGTLLSERTIGGYHNELYIDGAYVRCVQSNEYGEELHSSMLCGYDFTLSGYPCNIRMSTENTTCEAIIQLDGAYLEDNGPKLKIVASESRGYITGLTAPVDDTDAVNKAYVDKHFSPVEMLTDKAEYTLSANDMGKMLIGHLSAGGSGSCVVKIPVDADLTIPIGSEIEISKWNSGLDLTIQTEDGTTDSISIRTRDSNALASITLDGKYGIIALKRISDTKWYATGDIA